MVPEDNSETEKEEDIITNNNSNNTKNNNNADVHDMDNNEIDLRSTMPLADDGSDTDSDLKLLDGIRQNCSSNNNSINDNSVNENDNSKSNHNNSKSNNKDTIMDVTTATNNNNSNENTNFKKPDNLRVSGSSLVPDTDSKDSNSGNLSNSGNQSNVRSEMKRTPSIEELLLPTSVSTLFILDDFKFCCC